MSIPWNNVLQVRLCATRHPSNLMQPGVNYFTTLWKRLCATCYLLSFSSMDHQNSFSSPTVGRNFKNCQFSRKCSTRWKASRTLLGREQYIFLKNKKIRCEVQNCTGSKLHTMSLGRVLVDLVTVCIFTQLKKFFVKKQRSGFLSNNVSIIILRYPLSFT